MTLTLVGETEAFPTTGTAVTPAIPGGCVAGDFCVVTAIYDSGTNSLNTLPASMDAEIGNLLTGSSQRIRAWRRVLTSTQITAGTITLPGDDNYNGIRYQLWFFNGQDPTTPVNTSAFAYADSVGSNPILNFTSVTPSVDNCYVLLSGGCVFTSGTSWTSPPSGYTVDQNNPGGFVSDWSGSKQQTTAAATGTLHVTNTGATGGFWNTVVVVVAPAPPAAPLEAGHWALEDGSGFWKLEDGSGYWQLEGVPAVLPDGAFWGVKLK